MSQHHLKRDIGGQRSAAGGGGTDSMGSSQLTSPTTTTVAVASPTTTKASSSSSSPSPFLPFLPPAVAAIFAFLAKETVQLFRTIKGLVILVLVAQTCIGLLLTRYTRARPHTDPSDPPLFSVPSAVMCTEAIKLFVCFWWVFCTEFPTGKGGGGSSSSGGNGGTRGTSSSVGGGGGGGTSAAAVVTIGGCSGGNAEAVGRPSFASEVHVSGDVCGDAIAIEVEELPPRGVGGASLNNLSSHTHHSNTCSSSGAHSSNGNTSGGAGNGNVDGPAAPAPTHGSPPPSTNLAMAKLRHMFTDPRRFAAQCTFVVRSAMMHRDTWHMLPPAVLFTFQSNIIYVALQNVEVTLFQVLYQSKLLLTALFLSYAFKRSFNRLQWLSLVFLFLGVVVSQLGASSGGGGGAKKAKHEHHSNDDADGSGKSAAPPATDERLGERRLREQRKAKQHGGGPAVVEEDPDDDGFAAGYSGGNSGGGAVLLTTQSIPLVDSSLRIVVTAREGAGAKGYLFTQQQRLAHAAAEAVNEATTRLAIIPTAAADAEQQQQRKGGAHNSGGEQHPTEVLREGIANGDGAAKGAGDEDEEGAGELIILEKEAADDSTSPPSDSKAAEVVDGPSQGKNKGEGPHAQFAEVDGAAVVADGGVGGGEGSGDVAGNRRKMMAAAAAAPPPHPTPTIASPSTASSGGGYGESSLFGIIALLASSVSSAVAAVVMEKVLKDASSPQSLAVRNVQLAVFSLCLTAIVYYINSLPSDGDSGAVVAVVSSAAEWSRPYPPPLLYDYVGDFFLGFDGYVWVLVVNQAVGGIVVALVLKYADNILKGFAVAACIFICGLFSWAVWGTHLAPGFVLGATIVSISVVTYSVASV